MRSTGNKMGSTRWHGLTPPTLKTTWISILFCTWPHPFCRGNWKGGQASFPNSKPSFCWEPEHAWGKCFFNLGCQGCPGQWNFYMCWHPYKHFKASRPATHQEISSVRSTFGWNNVLLKLNCCWLKQFQQFSKSVIKVLKVFHPKILLTPNHS